MNQPYLAWTDETMPPAMRRQAQRLLEAAEINTTFSEAAISLSRLGEVTQQAALTMESFAEAIGSCACCFEIQGCDASQDDWERESLIIRTDAKSRRQWEIDRKADPHRRRRPRPTNKFPPEY